MMRRLAAPALATVAILVPSSLAAGQDFGAPVALVEGLVFEMPNGGGGAVDCELADLNGDSADDLIVLGSNHSLSVAFASGAAFGPATPIEFGSSYGECITSGKCASPLGGVAAGDVDGNGSIDLVYCWPTEDVVLLRLNDGSGAFPGPAAVLTPSGLDGSSDVQLADLDADGDLDVVAVGTNLDQHVTILNNGAGQFGPPTLLSTSLDAPRYVATGDMDGDGDIDIVSAGYGGGPVWYESVASGHVPAGSLGSLGDVNDLWITDVDLDGKLDVACVTWGGAAYWIRNMGTGSFAPPETVAGLLRGWGGTVADLNGDGLNDFVLASDYLECLPFYEHFDWCRGLGAGLGFGQKEVIFAGASVCSPIDALTHDLDGDGDLDVIAVAGNGVYAYTNLMGPFDCNGNGLDDSDDIASGFSQDCNGNGSPDECDIASGIGTDANGNGKLDECESDCDGDGADDELAIASGAVPDCNENGTPDSCDISSKVSLDQDLNGIPDECSPPLLAAFPTKFPASEGGTQQFTLTAGIDSTLDLYLLLGSTSGSTPGFPLGDLTLPLNIVDPYFNFTLLQPNSATLVSTFGVLDIQGTATASVNVPTSAQYPSLIGLTFHHAYVVLGNDLGVSLVSNSVELKLLP